LTPDLLTLERAADSAKYGRIPDRPHVELTAPSLTFPSLAPGGKHVLVARVQYAPHRLRDGAVWDDARRDALAETVTATIEGVAPGFRSRVLHRATFSPPDLEREFALVEGSPSRGELALDQVLFMRPVAGWGRYATPHRGPLPGRLGDAPGSGDPGRSRLAGGGKDAREMIAHSLREELARFDPALPIERAWTPPASWYLRSDVLDRERERVFTGTWQAVARLDRCAVPGDYVAGASAGSPYVGAPRHERTLRAFHNVCRHHAAQVCEGSGTLSS
jgi:hypothetical protein